MEIEESCGGRKVEIHGRERNPGLMECGGGRGILADFQGRGFVLGMCANFFCSVATDSGEVL